MIVSLILAAAITLVGLALYIHHRLAYGSDSATPADAPEAAEGDEQCCGLHLQCEKGLTATDQIIYYDDEELDAFRGRPADAYSDPETELFRDVLLTLLPSDIAGWARSLQLRGIEMPAAVRQEMMLIVTELRASAAPAASH